METCGVHLGGTLFLPAQGRTPRVPVKAAKGSCAERSQASSFIYARSKQASYRSGSCGYLCIALGSGGTFACLLLISLFQLTSFLFLIHSSDLQEVFCLAMLIIAQLSFLALNTITHRMLSASIFTCPWPSKVGKKTPGKQTVKDFQMSFIQSEFWFWCGLFRSLRGQLKIPRPAQIFCITLDAVHSFNPISYISRSSRPSLKHLP